MNETQFNIALIVLAICIAAASYAKGQADGWNKGFEACSDIWDKITDKDSVLDDEVIDA